jgi:hypothetical protein
MTVLPSLRIFGSVVSLALGFLACSSSGDDGRSAGGGGNVTGGSSASGAGAGAGAPAAGTGLGGASGGSSGSPQAGMTGMTGATAGAGGSAGAGGAPVAGSSSGGVGGGAAGSAPGGSDAGGGSNNGPCDIAGKILCEDFDSVAAGMLPSSAPFSPLNCFDSTHVLKVDGAAHHSGTQSLLGMKIPYADCQLHADLGAGLGEYWVRAWVYYGGAAPTAATHEVTVFELVPSASTDDPSIRVGYRGDTCMPIGIELNITGGGQEETGCTGAAPKVDTWSCYVLHVKQAATSITTDLSIDGVDQSYTNHGNPQTEITSQVAGVRYLRLGARSYSGNFDSPIYVDDVAVATQPLGCN